MKLIILTQPACMPPVRESWMLFAGRAMVAGTGM
jgi:hypothetical protein